MVVFFAALSLFATPAIGGTGKDSYGKEVLDSLEVFGTVKLYGTTISKELKVTGSLIAESAHLNQVEAAGDVRLSDTVIDRNIQVVGCLKAEKSYFHHPLVFMGQKGIFSACRLVGITVQRDGAFRSKQVIELREKTCVDGPIVFEAGGGEVHLHPGAKVYGSVSGGKIIHKSPF